MMKKNRILLITDLSGNTDEGIRNVGENFFKYLIKEQKTISIKLK